jgi:hypothetical protein
VVGKTEVTRGDANLRFVVTSLKPAEVIGQYLYVHCVRGEMESRIKECRRDLVCRSHLNRDDACQPVSTVAGF